jgi:ribosome-binding factor A
MSRSEKVAREIKKIVSDIVQKELHDPRMGFTTITRVELTADLLFAHIHFSVLGDEKQWESTAQALEHAAVFVRRRLGDEMNLRYVPEIVFKADHSAEYSIRIEQELERIHQEERHKAQERTKKHAAPKTVKGAKKKRA